MAFKNLKEFNWAYSQWYAEGNYESVCNNAKTLEDNGFEHFQFWITGKFQIFLDGADPFETAHSIVYIFGWDKVKNIRINPRSLMVEFK